jgi:hypothetical protein
VAEEVLTLLGVREDGVASIVDLDPNGLASARRRAEAMLAEHLSCTQVEIWREGALLARVSRA